MIDISGKHSKNVGNQNFDFLNVFVLIFESFLALIPFLTFFWGGPDVSNHVARTPTFISGLMIEQAI